MTLWANTLNGISSGTTVTTANSGGVSGTAFNAVSIPTGGSITAQATSAFEGATGLQIVWPATSVAGSVTFTGLAAAVGTRLSLSFWHKASASPATNDTLFSFANNGLNIRLNSAGQYYVVQSGASNAAAALATTTTVDPGTWVYIQAASTSNASTTAGRIEFRVTRADGTSLLIYDSGGTVNAFTSTLGSATFGRAVATTSAAYTSSYDLLAVDNSLASGFPGSPAPAPTYATGQFFPFL